jgi:hypothetical protein
VGKLKKPKNKFLYIAKKKPRQNPHLIEMEIKRLNKRMTNGVQSQRDELPILGMF